MIGIILQVLLVLILLFVTIVYLIFRRNYGYWKDRGVPFETPRFVFGNLSFLMRKSFYEFFFKLSKTYSDDYYGIFLAWKPALVVQTPELARRILLKDVDHFQNRYLYSGYDTDPLGSLNLFTVKNPIWTDMRHELSPLFTSMRLKNLTDLMNINSTELVNKIQRDYVDSNKPVCLKELFSMYTSDTVAYTVFGLRVSALNDPDASPLWFMTQHMVKWTFWRGFEFTMIFFLPDLAKLMRSHFFSQPATQYVKKLFWGVVEERKKTGSGSDKDLVNHLLRLRDNLKLPAEAGTQLADDLMMAQAAVFMLGAIETSSSTLSYCLHELAHHPKEQDKLYEEITNALKTSGKDILQYDDLLDLKYLSACINETLRKYPPVPYLDRVCNKPYQLNEAVTVEAGVPVFVNVVAIHHDPQHYPQPERWIPERITTLSDNDNMRFTFLPFGDGPRFCIGKRYGLMQIRTALAQMVAKYRFEPCDDEPYDVTPDPYSVMLAPKSGGRVKFVQRQSAAYTM